MIPKLNKREELLNLCGRNFDIRLYILHECVVHAHMRYFFFGLNGAQHSYDFET